VSLDLALPADWRCWDESSKERLLARLRAELIIQQKQQTFCTDRTPSDLAARLLGDRWHHRSYHDVLDQLALDLDARVIDMATLSMPPQTGKSSWVNWFVFWWNARHPEEPIIRMSYAAELAVSHAHVVQQYIEQYGGEFGLLPEKGSWAQHNWKTKTGAALRSGGMITGVSGYPAVLMLLDDPLAGRAQADSKLIRDNVWKEYSGSLVSRTRPGGVTLMVATRWHEDDPIGRLIKLHGDEAKGGRVRVINLPAIAGEDDVLGRAVGEPLPHPWIAEGDKAAALAHWEDKRRSSTQRDWFSLYQGDPKPIEGALLTEEQVAAATWREQELPEFVKTVVSIDPSGGGRDVAGIIGAGLMEDGRLIWTHDRSAQMGSDEWTHAACVLAHEIDANEIVYEKNYGGDTAKFLLRSVWNSLSEEAIENGEEEWGPCPRIVMVNAKKGKRVRAEPISVQVALGKVLFWGLFVLNLSSEWTTWQEDSKESPGRIDASCYAAYRCLKIPGADSVVSTGTAETPKQGTGKSALASKRVVRPSAGR
jgi:hypothetical protein